MQQLFDILLQYYLFDLDVFGNVWLYIPLGIPFIFYMVFFLFKWAIISAPIWIPIRMILKKSKK